MVERNSTSIPLVRLLIILECVYLSKFQLLEKLKRLYNEFEGLMCMWLTMMTAKISWEQILEMHEFSVRFYIRILDIFVGRNRGIKDFVIVLIILSDFHVLDEQRMGWYIRFTSLFWCVTCWDIFWFLFFHYKMEGWEGIILKHCQLGCS